jgi:hypothetical protein
MVYNVFLMRTFRLGGPEGDNVRDWTLPASLLARNFMWLGTHVTCASELCV